MAQIVTITNPLTGQPAQVDQLDHTAQEIDDAIARALPGGAIDSVLSSKPNPNLLDNWYFGDPVNQRGQTSYTGAGYGIDRWKIQSGSIVLNDNYISLIAPSSSAYAELRQWYETNDLVGKKATFSVLTDNGLRSTVLTIGTAKYVAFDDCVLYHTTSSGNILYEIRSIVGTTVNLIAAKLELGDTQTLAHQENGVWVLNEIPDYGEQLRRCQRYYYDSRFGSDKNSEGLYSRGAYAMVLDTASRHLAGSYRFPVTMRTNPSVKIYSFLGTENCVSYWESGADVPDTTANANNATVGPSGFNSVTASTTLGANIYAFHIVANAEL